MGVVLVIGALALLGGVLALVCFHTHLSVGAHPRAKGLHKQQNVQLCCVLQVPTAYW